MFLYYLFIIHVIYVMNDSILSVAKHLKWRQDKYMH